MLEAYRDLVWRGRFAAAARLFADLEAMAADEAGVDGWAVRDVPLLLMQGEKSWPPIPATMDALMAALPATTTRAVLEGQSHFATHTAPALFADTLRSF